MARGILRRGVRVRWSAWARDFRFSRVADETRFVAGYGGTTSLARRLHESAEQWDATGRLAFLNGWCVRGFWAGGGRLTVLGTGRTSLGKKVGFVFRVWGLTLDDVLCHGIQS